MAKFVSIGNNNSKLGQAIPSINLPAGVTCRPDAPCRKYCYACKGNFQFPSVRASMVNNYNAFCFNRELYFDDIAKRTALNKFVRWHSSGDIINIDYLVEVVKNECVFYPPFDRVKHIKIGRKYRKMLIDRYSAI